MKKILIQTGREAFFRHVFKVPLTVRITFLLLICVFFQAGAEVVYSQSKRISLDLRNVTVEEALNVIEEQSEFYFLYNTKLIDVDRKVNVKARNQLIFAVLDGMFASTDVAYKVEEKQIILSRKSWDSPVASQQDKTQITGTVTDESGEAVIGANVIEKGTTNGTVTDADGNFALTVANNAILQLSFIGYITQEISVLSVGGGGKPLVIKLIEDSKALDEVVVVGYGTRTKRDVTTAISNINSSTIEKSIAMSPEISMQGTMTGVQISGTTGNPMARPTIRIRGTNTWGVSDPLYVIDGIAITELGAGIEGHEDDRLSDVRGPLNIMSLIDPSDIESISVLKDASAAAIYGIRAANGVILITTKKGKKDKPTVDFSARYGIQNITQELDWLTVPEYTKFVQGIFASDPERTPHVDNVGRFDPNDPRYLGNSPTYNWQDAVKRKNAAVKNYSVKVSGGTDNTDYYLSLGYAGTEGNLLTNKLDRYSGAIKLNTKINDYVKTGFNYRLVSAKGIEIFQGDNYLELIRGAPWQPIYQADGIPGYNGYAFAAGGIQPDGTYASEKLYGYGTVKNMLGMVHSNDWSYESIRNIGNIYLELTPLKGLTIKGTLSMDSYSTAKYMFTDYSANPFSSSNGDPREKGGGKSVGSYEERDVFNNNFIQELMVNYTNSFNNHNLDFLFNFTNQHYNAKYKMGSTDYMTTKKDYLRNLGGENQYTVVESDQRRWALQGYLFRLGYNYKYKYYLDATLRYDGSARFAPENRWGTFPSVSVAYRIKSEESMNDVTWLNDLKLRAGWGQLGNQEVRDMAYLSIISTKPAYAFGNASVGGRLASGNFNMGATTFGMANADLTWEKTEILNVGFDALLLKNLSFSAEYYSKTTHGILQVIDLPPSTGVTENPVANIAKVRNSGFEFSANYSKTIDKFYYSVGFNLTTVKNQVMETYKHIPTSGGTVEEGHSMFYHKAFKVAGIFQTDEEADAWMANMEDVDYTKSKVGAGDFYFQDLRGAPKNEGEFYSEGPDGKIDTYDMVDIGKSIPGFYYGLNFSLGYLNFDFTAQFTGVGDVMRYNETKAKTFFPTEGNNVTRSVYKAWTPENRQHEYPRLVFGDPAYNMRQSNFFFESGAYCRLQNVQLGYTIPKSSYFNFLRNARIYLGASNVFTITEYTGLDPESDSYPMPQTFYAGLTIKF